MPETVLIVANFDSGLKYADRLAAAVEAAGAEPRLAAPTTTDAAHLLGGRQIAAATSRAVAFAPWDELVDQAQGATAVVPVGDGPRIQAFFRDVHERGAGGPLPVLGAGYVGMALYDLVGGYLMRALADVIAVNSASDLAEFEAAADAFGLPAAALTLCGLPLLPAAPAPMRTGPIRTVVYADQPTVPETIPQRAYLWDRLADHARLHPDRTVLLKPRHARGEDTFHRMRFSPETWAERRDLPPNLRIDHRPIPVLLERCDLLLTVSSTAALEAVAAGVRTAFVSDFFGDAQLNPPLLPSGLLRRFDQIDADALGTPDPRWLADVFPARSGPSPAERFADRLLAVARDEAPRSHGAAWDSPYLAGRRETDAALARMRRARFAPRRVAAGVLRRALGAVER